MLKRRVCFLSFFLSILYSCANTEGISPVPFEIVAKDGILPDGKFPGFIYYLDVHLDTLKNLADYGYVWIEVKDNELTITHDIYIPGDRTTDPIGVKQLEELRKMRYYAIKGDTSKPEPITLEDIRNHHSE
jgi:hypothetical protein